MAKTYRCTFPALYPAPGCPGHTDPSARQGHYITAVDAAGAANNVVARVRREGRDLTRLCREDGAFLVDVQEEGSAAWEATPAVRVPVVLLIVPGGR